MSSTKEIIGYYYYCKKTKQLKIQFLSRKEGIMSRCFIIISLEKNTVRAAI